jgi:hypothetical protein
MPPQGVEKENSINDDEKDRHAELLSAYLGI